MFKNFTKYLARAGIFAALYVVLSLAIFPLCSGAIQLRISEGICLLPLLFSEAVPAVFIGCLLVNIITGCALIDVVVGSLVTMLAASITYFIGKKVKNNILKIFLGGLAPVLLNSIVLPLIWCFYLQSTSYIYIIQFLLVLIGEGISVYAFGIPSYFLTKKLINKKIIKI